MRCFTAFILSSIYLLAMLQPIAPWAGYHLNKSFIAAERCENVNRPMLKCDGKCYLRKQVTQQDQEPSQPQQSCVEMEDLPSSLIAETLDLPKRSLEKRSFLQASNSFSNLFKDPVFHPPSC